MKPRQPLDIFFIQTVPIPADFFTNLIDKRQSLISTIKKRRPLIIKGSFSCDIGNYKIYACV
ncbi:hypothetical protein J6TS1_32330 [Siminovitchia terrae]|uniref:Translation initiation factor 1 n=1 Tax=Siminovitchia terrae TaxID=1914933 RepID=A0ABQ4KZ95_SIMTE|nr:hypothetical protein J22TS1_36520 [Siminovitchia terrae]GIN97363.1 hypothetical protein J6TS1_32330 [Siminovitchia terrae]